MSTKSCLEINIGKADISVYLDEKCHMIIEPISGCQRKVQINCCGMEIRRLYGRDSFIQL